MLVPFADLLAAADAQSAALGAFTAYNLEEAIGVLAAAEARRQPTMLLVSRQSFASRGGPALMAALVAVAQRAPIPCCVQLDHVADLELMRAALDAGAGAVMADGSTLPEAENVDLVRAAARIAREHGAGIEAELGHVAGDEEIAAAVRRGALTDPDQAIRFVERTGTSCLAVSIGNIHGRYSRPPQLDWARLEAIRNRVPVPLSLHGASGIPDADVHQSIRGGIRKVNVNTELRDRWFEVLAERAEELRSGARLLALNEALIDAVQDIVNRKLELFQGTVV